MRKLVRWITVLLVTLVVITACAHTIKLLQFRYASMWAYSADYGNYADEFNVVKKFILTQFPNETDKWLSVSYSGDNGIRLYDPDSGNYLTIPNNILSSLSTICNLGFPNKDSSLDVIRIHDDRISFCIPNGRYALVFSPNKKPSFVNSPDENYEIKVKSIGDGWYHVIIYAE